MSSSPLLDIMTFLSVELLNVGFEIVVSQLGISGCFPVVHFYGSKVQGENLSLVHDTLRGVSLLVSLQVQQWSWLDGIRDC